MSTILLREIAVARSGDKGNHANIGVVAKSPDDFEFLRRTLTKERVAEFFQSLKPTRVERFELPEIAGFNFMLYDVLDGGASRSLRFDTQGKLLGTALGDLQLERDS
jgi:hypothetical protein